MGTGDKIKGKVKEAVGSVTGSDHLRKEGQAEQRKGLHEQKAAEARAVAEKHEREAEFLEDEKRARQVVRRDMRDEPPVV
ncbi:MAG: CsbD family protein [Actinomycetota bacterium]|nr:CsbD family protein [Actinomycetota bacterium]